MSLQKQNRLLAQTPDIVVATPGRLWEIVSLDQDLMIAMRSIRYLVIDEADRMMESGHFKDLDDILSALSLDRRYDDPII
jgi:ATP-dependent RNA helicase DDX24/MAK5